MPILDRWSNLSLRAKGLIVVAVPATATVIIACGLYLLGANIVDQEELVRQSLRFSRDIERLRANDARDVASLRGLFLAPERVLSDRAGESIAGCSPTRENRRGLISQNSPQARRLAELASQQCVRAEDIFSSIARTRGRFSSEEQRESIERFEHESMKIERVLQEIETEEAQVLTTRLARVDALRAEHRAATVICMALGLVGGGVISLLFALGITDRIRRLDRNVAKLASGGAFDPLPGGRDEIGALSEGIALMAKTLKNRTAALEHALHGIAEVNAAGNCTAFNRAYAELAGVAESHTQPSVTETVHADDRGSVHTAIAVMQEMGFAEIEARISLPGGELADVTMTLIPVPDETSDGFYVFLRDNRPRKSAEMALMRAKDAAVSSNAAKTGFLAKISHDIRTPLNAILGSADMLSLTPLSPDQSEYVLMFQRNCRHLVRIINDFLDFSRIEAGAVELDKRPTQLREVVNEALATFREAAARKKIELALHVDTDLPACIMVDGSRIHQVLVNLLSNALKFTAAGRVDVSVKMLGLQKNRIRFEVRDTGPGVDVMDQERIFAPFTQLTEPKVSTHGSGLGLTICRELVQLMGGEIGILSLKGLGSTFHFEIPLDSEAPVAGESLPAGVPGLMDSPWSLDEPARVLVAEDTADNRILMEHYLRGEPVELHFACDGEEAVAMAREQEYDLILMDIDLPGMDGYEATRLIREWETDKGRVRTPVVALSAHAMEEAVQACLDAGCAAHVSKPVERSSLLRTIRRYALWKNLRPQNPTAVYPVAEGVDSLVPGYLASKPRQIEEARGSLAAGNYETIQRFGHNLKGTGRGYGFPIIESLGKDLETAASQHDENHVALSLAALHRFVTQQSANLDAAEPIVKAQSLRL